MGKFPKSCFLGRETKYCKSLPGSVSPPVTLGMSKISRGLGFSLDLDWNLNFSTPCLLERIGNREGFDFSKQHFGKSLGRKWLIPILKSSDNCCLGRRADVAL